MDVQASLLTLRNNALGFRQLLEKYRLLPDERWHWQRVERAFASIDGEIEARRALVEGTWRWVLVARGNKDTARVEQAFRNAARHAARVYGHYRRNAHGSRESLDVWLDVVARDEAGLSAISGGARGSVIEAAVQASERAAFHRRDEDAAP